MKILIIEDDQKISSLIKIIIYELSKDIEIINNGWSGLDAIINNSYDLILLDIMLPGLNGIEICKKAREKKIQTPIIMLTSKSEEDDKINGLDIGADDYITKPFSNKELLSRCKAVLRRYGTAVDVQKEQNKEITIRSLSISVINKLVIKDNVIINLTAKEFDLLYLFMENPGRNFSRMDILERVWGENFDGLEHTVNSTINRLRMKIEDDASNPEYLLTVWGIGYRFNK
jgi:two-component system, OmpR family, alkaline phosphatase synthesis response regulator PhoP